MATCVRDRSGRVATGPAQSSAPEGRRPIRFASGSCSQSVAWIVAASGPACDNPADPGRIREDPRAVGGGRHGDDGRLGQSGAAEVGPFHLQFPARGVAIMIRLSLLTATGAGPRPPGLRPATRRAPQDREGRRPRHLLPRGRAEGRPGDPPAARLPDQLADVPQPDPGAGGQVPRRRPGLPRLRPQLDAAARQVRLHLRQPGEGDRRVHREGRADEVRPLRAGLRRPGRLPPGGQAPGADHGHRGAERQRLRRGAGQRLLEADQGVLEGAEEQGEAGRHSAICSPTRRPSGSTRTG